MKKTQENVEKLRDTLIEVASDGRRLSDNADMLICRMAEAYIRDMSDEAFADYFNTYVTAPSLY